MTEFSQPDLTLPKSQRLCGKKQIEELYKKGSSIVVYPYRITYLLVPSPAETAPCPQILFAIPKRRFRKAVDRNQLRRRTREAYRHHKQLLQEALPTPSTFSLRIAFTYIGNQIFTYSFIEKKLSLGLRRLAETICQSPDHS
ncbi:ribonuclease P protein component [Catalinimonas alkaloidigena]|uniref:ribonuclease P protein component n=1 Tax=Catalinimonas alkaloidigena TaxID=1075417 RepID=UPI000B7D6412|nr:ribonuclease P protein component [Catalinimonas alkaloidigena]